MPSINWRQMYVLARSWGVQPSEFWGMTFSEWFAEFDFHLDSQPRSPGVLSPTEEQELRNWMDDGDT